MAIKRKASPPPPPQAHSSNQYSSSDEEDEHVLAPAVSSQPKPPPRSSEVDNDEFETESETDSDPDPPQPAKPMIVRHEPLEYEESSDEEDEVERKVEKPVLPLKKPESEPEKKKLKLSASAAARIWSKEDEMALLRALSEHHEKTGKLPASKDYAAFLSTVSGSIGFPVTEKQLSNKIRMMRQNYSKKKEKGTDAKISKPHDKAVFDMSTKLFNDRVRISKKGAKTGSSSDTDTDNGGVAGVCAANGRVANGGVTHTGAANGDTLSRSNFYLRSFIDEKIREHQLPSWLTVEDVVARFGELTVQKMNEKIKDLRIESMKLRAKEESMNVELFTSIAEVMAED